MKLGSKFKMEVLTSACFILILYCTEWFGFKQCYTIPVPTLLNYYDGSVKTNWNWKFRQLRNPELYHDKFIFPSKEPVLNIAERSGTSQKDSGKIFFPDQVPAMPNSPDKEKSYQFSYTESAPHWRIRHREEDSSNPNSGKFQETVPTVDVSTKSTIQEEPSLDAPRSPLISSAEKRRQMERDRVASAVQEWYQWYREKKIGNQLPLRKHKPDEASNPMGKPDPVISDQSLVAGLQNQKCPEGQIRLENGECRAKVEI